MAANSYDFKLNVIDTGSSKAAASINKNVNSINNTIKRTTTGTQAMAAQTRTASRSMRGHFGQLGHQVQDVAVQLQMGQNALLVFGQQGSQIASLFGPSGAIIGGLLAVAAAMVSAFIPSLMKSSQTTEEFVEQVLKLGKALKDATPEEMAFIVEQTAQAEQKLREELQKQEAELDKLIKKQALLKKEYEDNKGIQEYTAAFGAASSYAEANLASQKKVEKQIADQKRTILEAKQALQSFNLEQEKLKENSFVKALQEQAAVLGMTKTEVTLYKMSLEKLTPAQKASAEMAIAQIAAYEEVQEALKAQQKAQEEAQKKMEQYAERWATSVEDGFADIISGTKSVKDAFKDMVKSVISDLIKMQMQRTMGGGLKNLFMSALGMGAPVSTGGVPTNANWVNPGTYSPPAQTSAYGNLGATPFEGGGFTGYGGRSGGVDGKGGFPAILHPNETVIDHTKGQGGGQIVQNIHVNTGVSQTVRAEIANLMPQIIRAAQSATADARMRGGSYSSAMGA